MQHALNLAARLTETQRTRLAGLVAGYIEVMRHLVAVATLHRSTESELVYVGTVRRHDPVVRIHHDAGLGLTIQERHQFGKRLE